MYNHRIMNNEKWKDIGDKKKQEISFVSFEGRKTVEL